MTNENFKKKVFEEFTFFPSLASGPLPTRISLISNELDFFLLSTVVLLAVASVEVVVAAFFV